MFELPEIITLARQMNSVLPGKRVRDGLLGNRPHRFVWYNRTPDEFAALVANRTVGAADTAGKWLFVPLEPGHVLVLGEFDGRLLYDPPGSAEPDAYHLLLRFADGSALSVLTVMWGAMELYEQSAERERYYIRDMRPTPVDPEFTREYFDALVAEASDGRTRSVKSLLVQDQLVPGLGNSIAQDIMFAARLHPGRAVSGLSAAERGTLYEAIRATVAQAIRAGGRSDEVDLFGVPGGYRRVMDRHAAGQPCPRCGDTVRKLQYLGGACYLCPACQPRALAAAA